MPLCTNYSTEHNSYSELRTFNYCFQSIVTYLLYLLLCPQQFYCLQTLTRSKVFITTRRNHTATSKFKQSINKVIHIKKWVSTTYFFPNDCVISPHQPPDFHTNSWNCFHYYFLASTVNDDYRNPVTFRTLTWWKLIFILGTWEQANVNVNVIKDLPVGECWARSLSLRLTSLFHGYDACV